MPTRNAKFRIPKGVVHENGPPLFCLPLLDAIFIPGNVPSSKNSKEIAMRGEQHFLRNSDTVLRYKSAVRWVFVSYRWMFRKATQGLNPPFVIQFFFIRDSRRRFDFGNATQVILDMMVEYKWVEDDSMDWVLPVPVLPPEKAYVVDKDHCGVIIRVL